MAAVDLIGRPVLGWKVARVRPDLASIWGAQRIAGPAFNLWDATDDRPTISLIEGGYSAAEAEFQLLIREVPGEPAVTLDEAADSIGAVRTGIEIAGSPYPAINAHGPAVTVSDFGNNIGLVLGPQIGGGEQFGVTVASFLNGRQVGTGVAADAAGGPVESVRFLFELAARYGLAVAPGQWISAGAITGAHPVVPADRFVARFGAHGSVSCGFASAR